MDINATLLGQMIAFGVFVWVTMKFVWPNLATAMKERQEKINDGLAASERGREELEKAEAKQAEILKEARQQASDILEQANKRSNEIIEEARETARSEGERQLAQAQAQIEQEINQAKTELRDQVVTLAVTGASRVLEREVDAKAHNDLLQDLAKQL
ncbi:F0F1 ATP synthase subunit B [Aquisalimonas sp.]|uniref:F0F1 ATP synthase subunit B n=1 Tax=unclassified Aquisalimonas TaxID=2644645 RepID=UPI0025C0F3AC|nr:F0F1 ATP synthase subunit B [Aquisalimonas sp.]